MSKCNSQTNRKEKRNECMKEYKTETEKLEVLSKKPKTANYMKEYRKRKKMDSLRENTKENGLNNDGCKKKENLRSANNPVST